MENTGEHAKEFGEKASENLDHNLDEALNKAREALRKVDAKAEEFGKQAGVWAEDAASCIEKKITQLGKDTTDFTSKNPLLVGVGIIAVAGVLLCSILGACGTNNKRR